ASFVLTSVAWSTVVLRVPVSVVQPLAAPLLVLSLHHQHGPACRLGHAAAGLRSPGTIGEPGRALLAEELLPGVKRVRWDPDHRTEIRRRELASDPGIEDEYTLLAGEPPLPAILGVRSPQRARLLDAAGQPRRSRNRRLALLFDRHPFIPISSLGDLF